MTPLERTYHTETKMTWLQAATAPVLESEGRVSDPKENTIIAEWDSVNILCNPIILCLCHVFLQQSAINHSSYIYGMALHISAPQNTKTACVTVRVIKSISQ